MATIREVAERAGVSVATVSRVINNKSPVRAHLRARVEQVIKELDYHPSGIAKNMRNQTLRSIGVIIGDILNPFFTNVVRIVEEEAYQDGYSVILCNSNEDTDKEAAHLEFLHNERVAGIVWAPVGRLKEFPVNSIPIVLLDRHQQGLAVDSVVVDNIGGMRYAIQHLSALGHTRIGLISGPVNTSTGLERLNGYKLQLDQSNLPYDDELVVFGNYRESGGIDAIKHFLSLPNPPTAIIAGNNLMTIGALMALQEKKINIPDQMSLVGFDDMSWYPLMSPPITVVKQPIYELGHLAIDLLLRRMKDDREEFPLEISLQLQLIVRGSTSVPRSTMVFESA